jgi:hypothetical protein
MKWWKKWIDFMEIVPFEWKYLMVLHAIWIEIQFKYIEWNSNSIEAKLNWRKVGCKLVHKVLKICLCFPLSMVLEKKVSKIHIYEKTFFCSIQNKFETKIYFGKMKQVLEPKYYTNFDVTFVNRIFHVYGWCWVLGNHWHTMLDAINIGREAQ